MTPDEQGADLVAQLGALNVELAELQGRVVEVSERRRQVVLDLLRSGMSQAHVGVLLGVARARVGQIAKGPRGLRGAKR